MKIDEKLFYCWKKVEDLFSSSIFTLRGSWRLPSAALLRVRNPPENCGGWLHP
jgi:hypothetical protein